MARVLDSSRSDEDHSFFYDNPGALSYTIEIKSEEEDEKVDADYLKMSDDAGCNHYKRRCNVISTCCDRIFWCEQCHNEDESTDHPMFKEGVLEVICWNCSTRQDAVKTCSNCSMNMGDYFCSDCVIYEDDDSKGYSHCPDCGTCRAYRSDNLRHCYTCGWCRTAEEHVCVENFMAGNCPICLECFKDSDNEVFFMTCGHPIHPDCYARLFEESFNLVRCPICLKSDPVMNHYWVVRDQMVLNHPDPGSHQIQIYCDDCHQISSVRSHFLGNQCEFCSSYNTRKN